MEQFTQVFTYHPDFAIIICKQYQFAVPPGQVQAHLRTHHPSSTPQSRTAIQHAIWEMQGIADEKGHVKYPDLIQPPVQGLPIYTDGYKCKGQDDNGLECLYICRDVTGIQKHCKSQHGWVNSQKRGGNRRRKQGDNIDMWEEGQYCQRFFKYGP
jgi:hypothetical protein